MTEAVCMFCGDPEVGGSTRFPMCRRCFFDEWDKDRCPDGEEHNLKFDGHASFRNDPDRQLLKVSECRRCGAGLLNPA